MKAALVDTGALVALFDDAERRFEHYHAVVSALLNERVHLVTTWPCITEASYLLAPRNHRAMLDWLQSRAVTVQAFELDDVQEMSGWMDKYSEPGRTLMDFADASLYWLAIQMNSPVILTVDQKDFSRYRLPDGRAFEIV